MHPHIQAAFDYEALQIRTRHPEGEFDSKQRWFPSRSERRHCCESVRTPSAKWPYSLMKHCRSSKHVAEKYGITERELNRARFLVEKLGKTNLDEVADKLFTAICAIEKLGTEVSGTQALKLAEKILSGKLKPAPRLVQTSAVA
ncbi:MAG TPA: hypothetical protein VEF04_02060 [Blastocatellia bacterium]|nr:hypothetical protein [Blastocatellia bacterium]